MSDRIGDRLVILVCVIAIVLYLMGVIA